MANYLFGLYLKVFRGNLSPAKGTLLVFPQRVKIKSCAETAKKGQLRNLTTVS
jgi:hypothetical protein